MPRTLDAACYLPVIDNTFALADRETLLVLRRVSKSFKHRVDSILAHHVAIFFVRIDQEESAVIFRVASAAAFWKMPCIPGLQKKDEYRKWGKSEAHEEGYRAILKHVRVMDARGWFHSDITVWQYLVPITIYRGLSNVHTLRYNGITIHSELWAQAIPAKRVVMFLGFDDMLDIGPPSSEPMKPESLPFGPIAKGAEKLVVHLTHRSSINGEKSAIPYWPNSLRHVVFIFESSMGFRPRRQLPREHRGILAPVLGAMAVAIPSIKVTFVNMLNVDRALFAIDADIDTHAKIQEILTSYLVDIKAGKNGDRNQIARTVGSCLNFCTLDEYAATLTSNDFKLETDPDYNSCYLPNM